MPLKNIPCLHSILPYTILIDITFHVILLVFIQTLLLIYCFIFPSLIYRQQYNMNMSLFINYSKMYESSDLRLKKAEIRKCPNLHKYKYLRDSLPQRIFQELNDHTSQQYCSLSLIRLSHTKWLMVKAPGQTKFNDG